MESIREIVVPDNNKIELTIPDNFIGKRIEIIAMELEENPVETPSSKNRPFTGVKMKGTKNKTFEAVKLNLANYKFNREEAN